MNQITNTANAATLGFFASKTGLPFYYRIPIAAAYTVALLAAFKHDPYEEREKLAVFASAFITLSLEFSLDYFLKANINAPFIVACLLLLNIINSRLNLKFDNRLLRYYTIQEEAALVHELEESSKDSSANSFYQNPSAI